MALVVLRESEHGVNFINTINRIIESISSSVLKGEIKESCELTRVLDILGSYSAFDFHIAHRKYESFRVELRSFVAKMPWDLNYTTSQVRAWWHIERILTYLVGDSKRFLDISEGLNPP